MTKMRTFIERFYFADMSSIELTIALVLDNKSLLVCAVANDNTLISKELSPEMISSASLLTDELSDMQLTLIEAVWLKLKKINDEELEKFLGGGHIGLRYVLNEDEK